MLGSWRGAAMTVGLVLACSSVVRADVAAVDQAATVEAAAERILATAPGLLFPIEPVPKCNVLNNFGGMSKLYGSGRHQGVDIGAALDQQVYAVENGVLTSQFTEPADSAAGNGWTLLGDSDTQYRYYHLSSFAPGLAVGATVQRGDLIGFVGDTGNATPGGYHLHFEVRPGPAPYRTPVDPVPLLSIPHTCTVYPRP